MSVGSIKSVVQVVAIDTITFEVYPPSNAVFLIPIPFAMCFLLFSCLPHTLEARGLVRGNDVIINTSVEFLHHMTPAVT